MKSWYIYFVAMMAICGLGCNRTASKKQVMQIGPADAQCLNCDTLGTTVRMNMIQNHYPLDTKNVYAILLNPKRKSLIFGGDWTLQKWETNQPFLDFMAGQLKKSLSLEIKRFDAMQKKKYTFFF